MLPFIDSNLGCSVPTSWAWSMMSLATPSAASLIHTAKLIKQVHRETPAKNPRMGKTRPKLHVQLLLKYTNSIRQLQVGTLWIFEEKNIYNFGKKKKFRKNNKFACYFRGQIMFFLKFMVGCVTVWCIPVAVKMVWRQEDTQADSVPLTNVSQWGQLNFFPVLIQG
jgi:hypothetical protein